MLFSIRALLCYQHDKSKKSLVYVDGGHFGVRNEGMLDPPLILLFHMVDLLRSSSSSSSSSGGGGGSSSSSSSSSAAALVDASNMFVRSRLLSPLCRQLSAGGSHEMSEKGLYYLLKVLQLVLAHLKSDGGGGGAGGDHVHTTSSSSPPPREKGGTTTTTTTTVVDKNESVDLLLQEDVISCTVSLLHPAHLGLVQQWHETVDKTAPDVADLLHASVCLLQVILLLLLLLLIIITIATTKIIITIIFTSTTSLLLVLLLLLLLN